MDLPRRIREWRIDRMTERVARLLDVGCSGGVFLRRALESTSGAARIVHGDATSGFAESRVTRPGKGAQLLAASG